MRFYNLETNENIVNSCLNAPVVGSSFGVKQNKIIKPNWTPETNKSRFIFTNKWKHWRFLKKRIFKSIGGDTLVKLGYEKSNIW